MTGLMIGCWLLVASFASGCGNHPTAHESHLRSPEFEPLALPGDERLPIRIAADVVGSYDSLWGLKEVVTIEVEADSLFLRCSPAERYAVKIRDDGARSVTGHHGARLRRRGSRTLLYVGWMYREGLYQRRL